MADKKEIQMTQRGLALGSLDDMWRFAQYVVSSQLAPAGLKAPEQVVVALQTGAELGLPPMASLRSLAVINGKATLYGDAGLALVRRSGLLKAFEESIEGDIGLDLMKTPNNVHAKCTATREGRTVTGTFSVEDAKRAFLWMKKTKNGGVTPWVTHPQRMLKFKARAFVLRDLFGDVLEGLSFYEEFVGMEEPEPTNEDRIKADMGSKKVESVTMEGITTATEAKDLMNKAAMENAKPRPTVTYKGTPIEDLTDTEKCNVTAEVSDRVAELEEIIEAETSEPEWL